MRSLTVLLLISWATFAGAVEPDEVLDDPELEARARALSQEVRCPVCQNENIDESSAEIAKDLRVVVRERLVAGDTNEEVLEFLLARYGEFVLFEPRATGANLILWAIGPLALLAALGGGVVYLRGRSGVSSPGAATLSDAEEARLKALLSEERGV